MCLDRLGAPVRRCFPEGKEAARAGDVTGTIRSPSRPVSCAAGHDAGRSSLFDIPLLHNDLGLLCSAAGSLTGGCPRRYTHFSSIIS